MAATHRVLNIVELLEHILLQLEDTTATVQKPVTQLFVLKRVNTLFRDVITGSKPLRQLMWLERSRDEPITIAGVHWLFDKLKNRIDINLDDTVNNIQDIFDGKQELCLERKIIMPEGKPVGLLGAFASPDASWRGMHAIPTITDVDFSFNIKVPQSPNRHSVPLRFWKFKHGRREPVFFEILTVKSGEGLAKVYEEYLELFDQHMPRLRGIGWRLVLPGDSEAQQQFLQIP